MYVSDIKKETNGCVRLRDHHVRDVMKLHELDAFIETWKEDEEAGGGRVEEESCEDSIGKIYSVLENGVVGGVAAKRAENGVSHFPFTRLFGGDNKASVRSGVKLSTLNPDVSKQEIRRRLLAKEKKRAGDPNAFRVERPEDRVVNQRRVNNMLMQMVSDSHRVRVEKIRVQREERKLKSGYGKAANPDDYNPWDNFRDNSLPTVSKRTAIDCGINLIQQEVDKEAAKRDRENRLGRTVELDHDQEGGGKLNYHKATLQLLYLHNDENDR